MAEEKLDEIKSLLEDIKGIMLLTTQEEIESAKKKLLKPGSNEETVYKLCDGVNATADIATKLQKTNDYVHAVISTLRQKGLVKTNEKNGKKVYEQRF